MTAKNVVQGAQVNAGDARTLVTPLRFGERGVEHGDPLAEALDARVATNLKVGAAFPTDHPLHIGAPATLPAVSCANFACDCATCAGEAKAIWSAASWRC